MPEKTRNAPLWLKLLVGFHVVATLSWALPTSAPGVLNGQVEPTGLDWFLYGNDKYVRVSPIQQYILTFGLWQSWDMFAANPTNRDVWCDAVVTHRDGKRVLFQYPRVYEESYPWKYVKERYRKYYERAYLDSFQFMWEPFARRVALLADTEPGNPVSMVTLQRHYIQIPRTVTFRQYWDGLTKAIGEGRVTGEVLLPPSPPIPDFQVSPYYTLSIGPEPVTSP